MLVILGVTVGAGFIAASIWTNPSSLSVHYGQTGALILGWLVLIGFTAGFPE